MKARELTFKCVPLPFQKGDIVFTPNGKKAKVTAVGIHWCAETGRISAIVYRVGKSLYWHQWQLKKAVKARKV